MTRSEPLPSSAKAVPRSAPAHSEDEAFVTAWADLSDDGDDEPNPVRAGHAPNATETFVTSWSEIDEVTIDVTDSDAPAVALQYAPSWRRQAELGRPEHSS